MTPPFKIKHIDHIVLRVKDLDRMMKFYREVLGCAFEKEQAAIGLWQLRAGGSLIDLVPIDGLLGSRGGAGPGEEARNLDHFALRIETFDEDALRTHFEKHGVTVTQAGERYGAEGDGPSIYVLDPEGNEVEIKGPPRS
ncbi:MAG TPA: VOC family protein [Parvularculaceae bacterium]|nr:VOC family protein [Parvularculaceae bacterium]